MTYTENPIAWMLRRTSPSKWQSIQGVPNAHSKVEMRKGRFLKKGHRSYGSNIKCYPNSEEPATYSVEIQPNFT